jgi:hypothetical protein
MALKESRFTKNTFEKYVYSLCLHIELLFNIRLLATCSSNEYRCDSLNHAASCTTHPDMAQIVQYPNQHRDIELQVKVLRS